MEESATEVGGDGPGTFIPADHFQICRPSAGAGGFKENKYVLLRSFIVKVFKSEKPKWYNSITDQCYCRSLLAKSVHVEALNCHQMIVVTCARYLNQFTEWKLLPVSNSPEREDYF